MNNIFKNASLFALTVTCFVGTANAQNDVIQVNDFYKTIADKCRIKGSATLDVRTGKLAFRGTIKNRGRILGHTGYVGIRVFDRSGRRIGSYWATKGINAKGWGSPKVKSIGIDAQLPPGTSPFRIEVLAGKADSRPDDFRNPKPQSKRPVSNTQSGLTVMGVHWNLTASHGSPGMPTLWKLHNLSSKPILFFPSDKNMNKGNQFVLQPYKSYSFYSGTRRPSPLGYWAE